MAVFRDWIPEGEDLAGQGNGFRDFVAPPQPVKRDEAKVAEEVARVVEPPKPEPVVEVEPEVETEPNAVDELLTPRKRGKKNG